MNVNEYIDNLLRIEGGYVNDPADAGGETNWGITVAVARAYGYTGPMRDMPQATARAIYERRYWLEPRFDRIHAVAPAIAEELLDTGVNMGQGVAARFLQRALNVLNDQAKLYPDLTVDGQIGPMTVQALTRFLEARGIEGVRTLLATLNGLQAVRYIEICEAKPSQERFAYGWLSKRVAGAA
jgi:lysozyme family protein